VGYSMVAMKLQTQQSSKAKPCCSDVGFFF
jgi:hypothetical protein